MCKSGGIFKSQSMHGSLVCQIISWKFQAFWKLGTVKIVKLKYFDQRPIYILTVPDLLWVWYSQDPRLHTKDPCIQNIWEIQFFSYPLFNFYSRPLFGLSVEHSVFWKGILKDVCVSVWNRRLKYAWLYKVSQKKVTLTTYCM